MHTSTHFYFPADAILTSNLPTKLSGAAIGNGWIDGRTQYPAYLEYATKHGILEENSDVRVKHIQIGFVLSPVTVVERSQEVHRRMCHAV